MSVAIPSHAPRPRRERPWVQGALREVLRHPGRFNQVVRWSATRHLPDFLAELGGGCVLDVGCGERSVLPPHVDAVGLDLAPHPGVPVRASAAAIPFADACFAGVCHSWVLEHLEDPAAAVEECRRVLRPGGALYLTTNFVWHLHEAPRDFFRFTEYGLRSLLPDDRWEIVRLEPTARYWITLSQMLGYRVAALFARAGLRALHPAVTLPLQLAGIALEWLDPDETVCAGYALLARRR